MPDPGVFFVLKGMILAGLLAAAVAGGLLGILAFGFCKKPSCGSWPSGLAIFVGVMAAFVQVSGWPSYPPGEAVEWIPLLLTVVFISLLILDGIPFLSKIKFALFLPGFGVALWFVGKSSFSSLGTTAAALWIGGAALFLFLLSIPIFEPNASLNSLQRVLPLLVSSTLMAGCQLASGSATLGSLHAGVAGALAATALVLWLRPNIGFGSTAQACFLFPTLALLLVGHLYAELALGSLLLLVLSLQAAWVQAWLPQSRASGLKGLIVGTMLAGVPAGAAFAFAPIQG